MTPYKVVADFERAVGDYCHAPYVVSTNSCTMALFLCLKWCMNFWGASEHSIEIPKRTYISVPMSIIHAGGRVAFRDEDWKGSYELAPFPIYDSARRFTSGMYKPGTFQCVSFHASKILGDTQGGAILHDSPEADTWFRKARFDGRTEGVEPAKDNFNMLGFHCYMSSDVAARLLLKLYSLPEHNEDLENSEYPDLSIQSIFKTT